LSFALMVPGHMPVEQLPGALQNSHTERLVLAQSMSCAPQPQSQAWSP
jgi:hypothetical protein